MWETEPPPASFTLFGCLGLITTHSFDETVPGIKELVQHGEDHIWSGMLAYSALGKLRADPNDAKARAELAQYGDDLGYENATKPISRKPPGEPYRAWRFFLVIPHHGRVWLFLYSFVRPRVLPRIDRTDSESALVALGAGVHPAAPLDRRRGGLGRRGSRPPAMGRRRRSADFLAVSNISANNVLVTLIGFIGF
jgi:cytochrome bd ubiquinol oxidase subunit I